jgi:hypothetical protein
MQNMCCRDGTDGLEHHLVDVHTDTQVCNNITEIPSPVDEAKSGNAIIPGNANEASGDLRWRTRGSRPIRGIDPHI